MLILLPFCDLSVGLHMTLCKC